MYWLCPWRLNMSKQDLMNLFRSFDRKKTGILFTPLPNGKKGTRQRTPTQLIFSLNDRHVESSSSFFLSVDSFSPEQISLFKYLTRLRHKIGKSKRISGHIVSFRTVMELFNDENECASTTTIMMKIKMC